MDSALASQIAEIWVLYVVGALMIGARIFCRTKLVGFSNYQLDDYLVIAVAGMWTAAPVIGQVFVQVAQGRHTSDLTYDERKNMGPEESAEWTYGSQMFLFGLTGYFIILWTLKFNMLCFYSRVVRSLWTEKFVKPLMGFVGVSAAVIVLTLALTCRPFHHLWQVWPDPGPHCVPQNLVFFLVILVFNLLTDICIMLVPIPVLLGIQINFYQKIGLWFLFSLGFFCMFAAILRFVLIFNLNQRGVSAMWSLREDCVGIFVGQAPLVTPMLRRTFWVQAGYATDKSRTSNTRSRGDYYNNGSSNRRNPGESGHELQSTTHISSGGPGSGKPKDPYSMTTLGIGSESQEEIVGKGNTYTQHSSSVEQERPSLPGQHGGIMVQKSIDIQDSGPAYDESGVGATRWYS